MAKAKKAHLVKASVLNASSDEKGASFYVIAASAPEVNKDTALAAFKCEACATHFSAIKGSAPFCVTCGSEEVDVEDGEGALSAEEIVDDENLANVECSACGTHNIVTLQTASNLGTKLHCVTCGNGIEYMPPSEGVGEGDEVEENLEDVTAEADDEEDEDFDNADLTLTDDIEVDAAAKDDEAKKAESTESAEETKEDAEEAKADVAKADVVVAETEPKADKSASDADSTEGDADSEDEAEPDMEEASLAALVQGDLTIERYGDRIVAFVAGIPVGHLTRETAGGNANVFATTAFSNSIRHTVRQLGTEKALAHYNFQLAAVRFPVPELVATRVTAGVEKAQQEIASKIKDVGADMRQAISIVAAGLNKGWFKGSTHVLKDALKQELSASGFQNASRVLDKVFSQYSDPYHKSLFEKAAELLSKPIEFRNELAEAIGDMNYQSASDEDGEEVTDEEETTEARLEGAGLRRGGKTQETSSLNVSDLRSTVVELKSRNGGRLF